jgi:hypothetical protein
MGHLRVEATHAHLGHLGHLAPNFKYLKKKLCRQSEAHLFKFFYLN